MPVTETESAWKSLIADLEVECKTEVIKPVKRKASRPSRPSFQLAPPSTFPITSRPPAVSLNNGFNNGSVAGFSMGSMNGRPLQPPSHQRGMGMGAMSGLARNNRGGWGMAFNSRRVRPAPGSPPEVQKMIIPPPKPVPLPSTMPLRNWVRHFATINGAANPSSSSGSVSMSWRGMSKSHSKVDNSYLEDAAKIALSLAVKLEDQLLSRPSVHERDITLGNIVVLNTKDGEADFIKTSNPNGHSRDTRVLICALGRVYYELFTQGSSPPGTPMAIERRASTGNSISSENTTPGLFGRSLRISGDNGTDNTNNMEVENEELDSLNPRPQRRRREDQGPENSVQDKLQREGMPISICRLVGDMLENEDYKERLFVSDHAMSTMKDVVSDLKQMVDNPKLFLHDSLQMRWKPVIAEKLYCRDREMQDALAVAQRVSPQLGDTYEEIEDLGDSDHTLFPSNVQEVLMISGHSGSGKSSFVRELTTILKKRGWTYLHCKFDRVQTQPLSFIISAFDRYFAKLESELKQSMLDDMESNKLKSVQAQIQKSFGEENMNILCSLIPSMINLMQYESPLPEYQGHDNSFDTTDAVASKCRLHHILGVLVRCVETPVLIFLDDLHWADQASLELIVALMGGIGEEINEGAALESNKGGILFVGTFRTNELSDTHPLAISLEQVKKLNSVNFTEIQLDGLSSTDVNVMVSEALGYPKRLSRSLADLIHYKSTGNPLFVKEFLSDLAVGNLLNYSLLARKWEWDEEKISERTISNGVAELLTRRLLRLPKSVRSALHVLSIFGSSVSMQVLSHVRDVCGHADIIAELDVAIREGLVEKTGGACRFVHDMIQQSVHSGINSNVRSSMLHEISETLLARTGEDPADNVLFIIVDLINRIGPGGASTVDHMRYASLNLMAGEKAIQIPDFGSACTYLESGISFLGGEDYWLESYNLSLHLFKNAAFVQYAQGRTDLFSLRLNEVLDNARTFDDKLDSLNLLIHSLAMDSGGTEKSFEKSFWVLEQLGESFPPADNGTIVKELIGAKNKLEQYLPSNIASIQPMEDPQKIRAMETFPALLMQCYQQKSRYYPLVACRMATNTLQYGLHQNSALGICSLALAYATVFRDMSVGYKLGKYALSITSNKNMPDVYMTHFGMISVWKEPIQAVLPDLLKAYNTGLKQGNISQALINSMLYTYRAFLSGSNLSSMNKEVKIFIRQCYLYKRHLLCLSLIPFSNAVFRLTGYDHNPEKDKMVKFDEEDQILQNSLEKKEIATCETIIVCKMMSSFISRNLKEAEDVARQYLDLLEQQDSGGAILFMNIHRYFYGGLIAYDCFRRTKDQFWMDMGDRSLSKFEAWSVECEWNFNNKFLLLQAEQYFATGNINEATSTYIKAISSSKDHRFIHEEALSCELASIFFAQTGKVERSFHLLERAKECYKSWGAKEKVTALESSLR